MRAANANARQAGSGLPDFIRTRLDSAAAASEAGLPSNMDAWDGYPAARERVFKAALNADANLLVLAGDTHNGWAFELAQDGAKVGVELGVCFALTWSCYVGGDRHCGKCGTCVERKEAFVRAGVSDPTDYAA